MPIARIGPRLVYFAHVPKCAGSSVEDYLAVRFGPPALLDRQHLAQAPEVRWSRTSPQHLDWASLTRLVPPAWFDAVFAVVRHPVARAVSAWRFQAEVEGTVAQGTSFADWLAGEAAARRRDPFASDNHSRPQSDFLPPAGGPPCTLFHLEHGLDALVPWLDALAGDRGGPRLLGHRLPGARPAQAAAPPPAPTAAEIALCAEIYAADFAALGYLPERSAPLAPPPVLDAARLAEAAAARARAGRPLNRLAARIGRRLVRMGS